MQIVSVKKRLSVSAASVWALIRQGSGVDRWLPVITSCRLEGTGPGAVRICGTAQGHVLEETLEVVDDPGRIFQYRIDRQDMLPTTNVRGTMHVGEDGAGRAEVLWFVTYELVDPAVGEAVRSSLTDAYAQGLLGLERLARETT